MSAAAEVRRIAAQIADLLDADQDMKALKLASALAGRLPRYRADVDALFVLLNIDDVSRAHRKISTRELHITQLIEEKKTLLDEKNALDLRLRQLEVLVGGANIEERIHAALADQAFAWLAHGELLVTVDKLQARLDAAERRS